MAEARRIATVRPWRERLFPNHEWVLLGLLLLEVAVFGIIGQNFLSGANAGLIVRMSVEIGLLALAMTPVIITGGIDLSVGSLMGLSAVLLGWLIEAQSVPVPVAIVAVLLLGALAGGLNAVLIARLEIPPLIVTLGTFSLYRGLAEGVTGGVINYSHLPAGYLALGQGDLGGIPLQLPVLVVAVVAFWLLVHRSKIGRGIYAVGHSADGARFAGVPVARRIALVYVLSGLMAALAAVVYVSRLGQAKADAGTGYELLAITAVVLGGTSIFGGKGTLGGTLLGLFAVVVLGNGLRLAALPAELADVLTGALLITAILGHRLAGRPVVATATDETEEFEMKNSQVAVLAAAMIFSSLLIASGSWILAARIGPQPPAIAPPVPPPSGQAQQIPGPTFMPAPKAGKRITVAMMPKNKGDAYFVSCKEGAEAAAKELGIDLLWDGPTQPDPIKQNEVVDAWITKGVDVIAVSVENKEAISTVLRKARAKGIKVLTWDADSAEDARDFLINQATAEGIGTTLMDEAARVMNNKGEFAIITASMTAANQNDWIKYIKMEQAAKFPDIKLATIEPCDDKRDVAFSKTKDVLNANPNIKLVMAIAAPAVPGAAEAVQQSGRKDVQVTGLTLPSMAKTFIHAGIVEHIVLWKTGDLGYLTVVAAKALTDGTLKAGTTTFKGGKLGDIEVKGTEVLLGKPFVFNKGNVDQFNF